MSSVPYISSHQSESVLTYQDLIPAIEIAFADFSNRERGGVVQSVRAKLPIREQGGTFYCMPAYSKRQESIACKLLTAFPKNEKGHPKLQGIITLFDGNHGTLKAVLDADCITGMRTAAASAVATKYLAPDNSQILAILGAGLQAKTHLEALRTIIPFKEVRVWNRTHARAETFAAQHGCIACETAEEAVSDADVIVTATRTSTPVLMNDWVKEGAHINGINGNFPNKQELESALVCRSVVYADSVEGALKESGDIILSKADIFGEIGDVVLGNIKARNNETTFFKSLGMAVEDVVAASLVYNKLHKDQPAISVE